MANKKLTEVTAVSTINDADYLFVNQNQAIRQIKKSDIPKPTYTADEVGALPNTTTTLPNPNALTFTGAATGSYDGSSPVEINIPEGGGTGVTVDTTLSVAGQAADAKATGDAISSLSEEIGEYGIYVGDTQPTNGVMYWLDTSEDTPDEPEVTLTSILANYTGGDVAVGTELSALTGITVTGTYSDGSKSEITGYTLSGEIVEGTNTITVSYSGLTTTFTVTGIAESGGGDTNEPILHLTNLVLDGSENEPIDTGVSLFDGEDRDWTVLTHFTSSVKGATNVWQVLNDMNNFIGIVSVSSYIWRAVYGNNTKGYINLDTDATNGVKYIMTHTKGQNRVTIYYLKGGSMTTVNTETATLNEGIYTKTIRYGAKVSGTKNFTGTINELTAYSKVITENEIKGYLGVA